MKKTQVQAILSYLRKHRRATNMELTTALWIACPWKRIDEITTPYGKYVWTSRGGKQDEYGNYQERITRRFIKTSTGKRVVQYQLERVKA